MRIEEEEIHNGISQSLVSILTTFIACPRQQVFQTKNDHHDLQPKWPSMHLIGEQRLNCSHPPTFLITISGLAYMDKLLYYTMTLPMFSNSASPTIKTASRRLNGKRKFSRYSGLIRSSYNFTGSLSEAYVSNIILWDHCGPITVECSHLFPT